MGERTVYIDCDVIEADGGTRCAAVTGGYLALHLAFKRAVDARSTEGRLPLADSVAAVSVGVVGGEPVVDLEYVEDCVAEVDMNVVMTGSGKAHRGTGHCRSAPRSSGRCSTTLLELADSRDRTASARSQSAVIARGRTSAQGGTSRP